MNSQSFTIRLASQTDLPRVCDIDYEAFSPYGTAESPQIIATRLAVFLEGFVVLEKGGAVLGYGSSEKWLHDREPALDEDPSRTRHPYGQIFCITAMAVRRAYSKQGFGSAILERLMSVVRQQRFKRVILETTHTQQYYLRRGFQVVKERQQGHVVLYIMQFALENVNA